MYPLITYHDFRFRLNQAAMKVLNLEHNYGVDLVNYGGDTYISSDKHTHSVNFSRSGGHFYNKGLAVDLGLTNGKYLLQTCHLTGFFKLIKIK